MNWNSSKRFWDTTMTVLCYTRWVKTHLMTSSTGWPPHSRLPPQLPRCLAPVIRLNNRPAPNHWTTARDRRRWVESVCHSNSFVWSTCVCLSWCGSNDVIIRNHICIQENMAVLIDFDTCLPFKLIPTTCELIIIIIIKKQRLQWHYHVKVKVNVYLYSASSWTHL